MEIIATTALISINETFIVQLVSFLIFLYVMNRFMFRPLLNTMEDRSDYLDRVKEEIVAGRDDLDRLLRDMEKQRVAVIKEAEHVVYTLESEGDQQAKQVIDKALQQIVDLRKESEARVKEQVKQARQDLAGDVDVVAVIIMEKVLQRRLTA